MNFIFQTLPDPFVIPDFRHATENNLEREVLKDDDRCYMVRTLATLLMSHIPSPSKNDCMIVSRAVHKKFPFLKEDGSEVCNEIYLCITY